MVPDGATWRYLDDGSDQGTGWYAAGFDDSLWSSGSAELGYGDEDEVTLVGFGSSSDDKHITTYFRRVFDLEDANALVRADLRLLRDDGAVVYLNGVEVVRSNLPEGIVFFDTRASSRVGGAEESVYHTFAVDPVHFVDGENTVAVEIHQIDPGSSDISFDLRLTASDTAITVIRGPYLQMGTPTTVVLRWRTDSDTDSCVRFGIA